jgi:hypothetical protein
MLLQVASLSSGTYTITIRGTGENNLMRTCTFTFTVVVPPAESSDDADVKEVGVWHADIYNDDDAFGFLLKLNEMGFTWRFRFWEGNVKVDHFTTEDSRYVDAVDFAYVAMHGENARFDPPSGYVYLNNCVWGDIDLEWMFTRTCLTLNKNTINNVVYTFDDHLHGITGYDTEIRRSTNFGLLFAYDLTNTNPKSIKEAWFYRNRQFDNENEWAAIYRGICWYYPTNSIYFDYGDEYLPGYGTGMRIDPPCYGYHGEDYYWLRAYHRIRCTSWGEEEGWYE